MNNITDTARPPASCPRMKGETMNLIDVALPMFTTV